MMNRNTVCRTPRGASDAKLVRVAAWIFGLCMTLSLVSCARKVATVPAPAVTAKAMAKAPIPSFVPDAPTKISGCVSDNKNPDHGCTPGAVMNISLETICTQSTKNRRNVPEELKSQVYAAYGLPRREPSGAFEVDHYMPLELGGDNVLANLWPEPAQPVPGFHQKDWVETDLHKKVCSGAMSLSDAWRTITTDWLSYYQQNHQ